MASRHTKKQILLLVEGAHTDARLMKHLFKMYGLDFRYEIVSYNTNIYVLYNDMFRNGEPDTLDLSQVLKERERNPDRRKLLDIQYTDILLIFDLDPQDKSFTEDKILSMMRFFSESSDMGKLYINYPMVESFYHMKSIPDPDYDSYIATIDELKARSYKARVNSINRNHNYSKFAIDCTECSIIINQNLSKARMLTCEDQYGNEQDFGSLNDVSILEKQLFLIRTQRKVSILCTCIFFIPEYNRQLITQGQ